MDNSIPLPAAMPTPTAANDASAVLAAVDIASATHVIDARPLPCAERQAQVFAAAAALLPGQSFLLINDHDPRPLHGGLCQHFQVAWTWAYEAPGPDVYVVRVGRPAEG